MGELAQAIIDGLVQGISEYLPISSSAHLYLVWLWRGISEDPLSRIVIVHLATLFGAGWALRARWLPGLRQLWSRGVRASLADSGKLAHIGVASIPALAAGGLLHSLVSGLYNLAVVASATLLFGIALAAAWRYGSARRDWQGINMVDALLAGLAQALALIPGVSRSGVCITALLARGIHPADAARFSVFMALPVIAATVVWLGRRWWLAPDFIDPLGDISAGLVAFAASWLVVRYGLPYLERSPQGWIVWACIAWRLALGCLLLTGLALGWLS